MKAKGVDLSRVLEAWTYDEADNVRRVTTESGRKVLQVRLPLGVEQYELVGRPAGPSRIRKLICKILVCTENPYNVFVRGIFKNYTNFISIFAHKNVLNIIVRTKILKILAQNFWCTKMFLKVLY